MKTIATPLLVGLGLLSLMIAAQARASSIQPKASTLTQSVDAKTTPTPNLSIGPRPGQWQINRMVEGAPRSIPPHSASVCLDAVALKQPETAFRKASLSSGSEAPECTFNEIQRFPNSIKWGGSCSTPRGGTDRAAMTGSATLAADSFESTQTITLKAALMQLRITERISAARTGECKPIPDAR